MNRSKYGYRGAVKDGFGNIVISDCHAETIASSSAEAKRNILWRMKKRLGLTADARLSLSGKIFLMML